MERGLYRSQVRRRAVQPAGAGARRGHNRQLYEALAARSARGIEMGVQDRRDQSDRRAGIERDRFDLRYSKGPFRAFYQMYYLPSALRTVNATVENDQMPHISGNTRHSVSIQYEFPNQI